MKLLADVILPCLTFSLIPVWIGMIFYWTWREDQIMKKNPHRS